MGNATAEVAPSASIRRHLFQVLLLCVFPVGLFAGVMLFLLWQAQERQREVLQIEAVRLLAAAVDNALDGSIQRISIMARLWGSSAAGEAQVYEQSKRALAASPDWDNVIAFTAEGRGVFRTDLPFGSSMPPSALMDTWAPVLKEQRPVITDVFMSRLRHQGIVSIGVPVVRQGRVTHILVASLKASWFDEMMRKQGLPPGGIAAIFDKHIRFVARSEEGERLRGADPSAGVADALRAKPEGVARFTNLSSTSVYTAWTGTHHGWYVAAATPAAPIDGAFWRYFAVFCGLWVAVLAAGVAFAVWKGRSIAGSIAVVEGQADYLGRGNRPPPQGASGVLEIDRALAALERAGAVLEQAMRDRERALEVERAARREAETASRGKDEFIAMLGHELRNPLAAVSNAVAIVQSVAHTDETLKFAAGVIARQSAHLKRLIDDLLQVGRVMSGKILLDRRPLDLAASVRHVAASLQTAGRLAGRRLELDLRPAWVNGDLTRIEQIVANLLANAAAYSSEGGRIRVSVAGQDGQAVLRVEDDGVGIAPEHLGRIFDLFYQAQPGADRARGGLGIGLTLVQRLVELHGGGVSAASDGQGRGAAFIVRLPAIEAPRQPAEHAPAPKPVPRRILVVEDNVDTRQSLRLALELQGHGVVDAGDGSAALEAMRRAQPEIALIDLGLPGMDGFELARRIRAEFQAAPRLIALSGYGAPADIERARAAGFDEHLTKPVEIPDLLVILARPS